MNVTDKNMQAQGETKSIFSKIKSRIKRSRKNDVVIQIDSEGSSLLSADDKPNNKDVEDNVDNGKFKNLANRIVHNKIKEDKDEVPPKMLQVVDDAMKNEFGGWGAGSQKKRRIESVNTDLLESIELDDYKLSMEALEKGASVEATCVQTGLTACHIAAYYGREKILKELIERDANILRGDGEGRLPLDIAVWQGHIECVEMLLRAKDSKKEHVSSPELWGDSINHDCLGFKKKISGIYIGCSALYIASARLQLECVKMLLEADYSPHLCNLEGMTPLDVCGKAYVDDIASITETRFLETLREFITFTKLKKLESYVQNPIRNHDKSKLSTSPLHLAVLLNSEDSIQLLLDVNAYHGCQDNQGETPLHLAVIHKMIKPLKTLTDFCPYGQDNVVDVLNNEKYTALHMAVKSQWMKGVSILLEAGSDIMAVTGEGNTVLHLAVETGNLLLLKELIRHLPDKNESINYKNSDGETPLYTAIIYGKISCMEELLLEKASCSITLKDGVNILHICAQNGCYTALSILLAENSNKELINMKGDVCKMTPLHWAALKNHLQCVISLCNAGADTKLPNEVGITPIHVAAFCGHDNIVKWMLDYDPSLVVETDNLGRTPFQLAAYFGHRKCITLFLERGADISEKTFYASGKTSTVLANIFSGMPDPVGYLEDIFNGCINKSPWRLLDPSHCKITIDYSILMPKRSDTHKSNRQLGTMNVVKALTSIDKNYDIKKLVTHPLIESFMCLQWKKFKVFYYFTFTIYGSFTLYLTLLVLNIYKSNDFPNKSSSTVSSQIPFNILVWIMAILISLQEILFIISKKFEYILSFEVLIKLASLILGIAVTIIDHKDESHWPRYVTAGAILLSWMELIIILSRYPMFGFLYQMFSAVALRALKVIVLFGSFIIIGFSLAFWILFESKAPFKGPWRSIMKTIVMMTSEFDYAAMADDKGWAEYPTFPQILFILFLIFVPIVVMNLLLALAISDTKDLEIEGKIQRLSQQIDFLSTLENIFSTVPWGYIPVWIKIGLERNKTPTKIVIEQSRQHKCLNECMINSILQKLTEKKNVENNTLATKKFASQIEDIQKMVEIMLKNTNNNVIKNK